MITLLRTRGYHPLDSDLAPHFSLAGSRTTYQIVVPREEEAAVTDLLRELPHGQGGTASGPGGARQCAPRSFSAPRRCGQCGSTMEEGHFASAESDAKLQPATWMSGSADAQLFGEVQVRSYRCPHCGLFESYAG